MALTARENRGRDLVHLCGCQDENGMRRRLLERLQQCIEGRRGKHVHLIHDVDFETALVGCEVDPITQIAHILDTRVGGCIDLDQIKETPLIERRAVVTNIAWSFVERFIQTVDCLGKQARGGGFPRAARPRKQVRMGDTPTLDCISERTYDVVLTHDLIPCCRSPFAVKRL